MTKWYRRHVGEVPIFGWSFYRQGTGNHNNISSDEFLQSALEWFNLSPDGFSSYAKAMALVHYLRQQRVLLILDGVEPLQDQHTGELRDFPLQDLIRELAVQNAGLLLCTTRVLLPDLGYDRTAISLDNLSETDGTRYLREKFEVHGSDVELRKASRAYGNHALALTLLGSYLRRMGGDISRRFEIAKLPALKDRFGQHARRVMDSYAKLFNGQPEGEILKAIGFFDRPADRDALKVVLGESEINEEALANLREARLLISGEDSPDLIDCHPLVREHFAAWMKTEEPESFAKGHSALFDYYCKKQAKELPTTLAEMTPLFHAVGHGCRAGRHEEARAQVYRDRIRHGEDQSFLVDRLCAWGTNLALLANFFEKPWSQPVANLADNDRFWVLHDAAFTLQTLGRLKDAAEQMGRSAEAFVQQEDWENAAITYSNFSGLLLNLGQIGDAISAARASVEFADRSNDPVEKMVNRTTLCGRTPPVWTSEH